MEVLNRKEEEGSRIWLGFPHAGSWVRNFGTRCSLSCCFSSFLLPVRDSSRQSAHRLPSQCRG